jgi:hypothetical protein
MKAPLQGQLFEEQNHVATLSVEAHGTQSAPG